MFIALRADYAEDLLPHAQSTLKSKSYPIFTIQQE